MWGIRVGIRGIRGGGRMQGIRVRMLGSRVGMRGICVILCENLCVY